MYFQCFDTNWMTVKSDAEPISYIRCQLSQLSDITSLNSVKVDGMEMMQVTPLRRTLAIFP